MLHFINYNYFLENKNFMFQIELIYLITRKELILLCNLYHIIISDQIL
jgi:hypothetical protein